MQRKPGGTQHAFRRPGKRHGRHPERHGAPSWPDPLWWYLPGFQRLDASAHAPPCYEQPASYLCLHPREPSHGRRRPRSSACPRNGVDLPVTASCRQDFQLAFPKLGSGAAVSARQFDGLRGVRVKWMPVASSRVSQNECSDESRPSLFPALTIIPTKPTGGAK